MDRGAADLALPEKAMELLRYAIRYQMRAGYMPTVREMAARFGMKSTAGPRYYLRMLEARGYVVLARGLARTMIITPGGRMAASGR